MKKCQAVTVCASGESGCRVGEICYVFSYGEHVGKEEVNRSERDCIGGSSWKLGCHALLQALVRKLLEGQVSFQMHKEPLRRIVWGTFTGCQAIDTKFHEEIFKMF